MKNTPLSDEDIASWIDNLEELWMWWRGSGLSKETFIDLYRDSLIEYIKGHRGDTQ